LENMIHVHAKEELVTDDEKEKEKGEGFFQ
jgi:hypothetical protein